MHFTKNLPWHPSRRSKEEHSEKEHHWTRQKSTKIEDVQPEAENGNEETFSASTAYFRLWKYASLLDWILRVVGAGAALGAGVAYPLMTLIFGNLVNDFNAIALGLESPAQFRHSINQNSLKFVYLFLGKFGVRIVHLERYFKRIQFC